MPSGLPLIKSKILLPRRQPALLRRQRLVDNIDANIHHKLILVSASAGYGKTSLLIDYGHDTELPVCWYSMDRNDGHIFTFIEYLVAAIRQRYPEFGASVLQAMRTFDGPEEAVEPFARLLVNEIQENVQDYFVLVLDDFHHVADSATVNALLDGLLLWLPEHCHIILASRGIPRRLTLTRLARDRDVAGIGVEVLAFEADEIHALLQRLGYHEVDLALATELAERSEGWITGVLLAAQSDLSSSKGILASSLASGGVFEFLANEILERQTRQVQDFMLGTSLLREMSAPLCDALLGIDNSATLLHRLAQDNLFISSIDAAGNLYQYHQLYREFLQSRLEAHSPRRYHDLCVAHADLMVNQEHWPDAIAAYLDAQAHSEAAEAIEIVAAETIDGGDRVRVGSWIDMLPDATLEQHPRLLVHRGHIASEAGEPVKALDFLERARRVFDAQGNALGSALAVVRMAFPQRLRGRYQDAIEACQLALVLAAGNDPRIALMAHSQTSICHGLMGNMDQSLKEMSQALDIARAVGDDVNAAYAVTDMGNIEINRGNLQEARQHFHQALLYWRKIGNQAALSSALQGLGMLHHHLGQYADASARFSQSLDSARAAQDVRLEAYSLANMGDLMRDMGRYGEAVEQYSQGIERAFASQSSYLILYLQAAQAEAMALRVLNGRAADDDPATVLASAVRLVGETLDQVDASEMPQEAGLAHLSLALIRLAQERRSEAAEHAASAVANLQATGYERDCARAHVVAALVGRHHDQEQVRTHMARVAELSGRIGGHQFLVGFGPIARELLDWLEREPIRGLNTAEIRAEIETLHPSAATTSPLQVRHGNVRLQLLGLDGGQVLQFGEVVTTWEADAARLMAFLLASHPQGLERDQITEMLWPEVNIAKGSSRCYSTTHRVRNALGKNAVLRQSTGYVLNPEIDYRYDVDEFTRLAQIRLGDTGAARLARRQAIALYRTDFMATCDLDWCDRLRQELRSTLTRLLHLEASDLEHSTATEEALALFARLQILDPLDERAHRGILRCRGALNDMAGVMRQWQLCQQILADELGVEPSRETRTIAMDLLQGYPSSRD